MADAPGLAMPIASVLPPWRLPAQAAVSHVQVLQGEEVQGCVWTGISIQLVSDGPRLSHVLLYRRRGCRYDD